ncbi:MAG: hypothetical protein FJZ90_11185 [Chloroflexi bacterium]|nr:hypothetical protein [Chloroflexota bacterium]
MSIGLKTRLDHKFAQESLSPYLDGRLSARAERRVKRHLDECGECREELASLRMTQRLLRGLPGLAAPRSFALPLSVQGEQTRYRRWNLAYGIVRVAAMAVSFALVVLLSSDALISSGVLFPQPGADRGALRVAQVETEHIVEEEVAAPAEPLEEAAPVAVAAPAVAATAAAPAEETARGLGAAERPVPAMDGLGAAGYGEGGTLALVPPGAGTGSVEDAEEPGAFEKGLVMEAAPRPVAEEELAAAPEQPMAERTLAMSATPAAATPLSPLARPAAAVEEPAPTKPAVAPAERAVAPSGAGVTSAAPVEAEAEAPQTEEEVAAKIAEALPEPALTQPAEAAPLRPAPATMEAAPAPAPLTHELSPLWDIWRAVRLASGVLLGLLFMLLGGLVWTGHKRRL